MISIDKVFGGAHLNVIKKNNDSIIESNFTNQALMLLDRDATLSPNGNLQELLENWVGCNSTERAQLVDEWKNIKAPKRFQPPIFQAPIIDGARVMIAGSRRYLEPSEERYPIPAMLKFSTAFGSPENNILLPEVSDRWDVDAVLGAVIGRNLFRADIKEARSAIVGYTLIADVTDRLRFDAEAKTNNGLMSKNYRSLSTIGPCVWLPFTQDERVGRITLRINGLESQSFEMDDLLWSAGEIASWWSASKLLPGDIIGLGPAIHRKGSGMIPPNSIKAGDNIEVFCKKIGALKMSVAT